jgi:hypothetical protein
MDICAHGDHMDICAHCDHVDIYAHGASRDPSNAGDIANAGHSEKSQQHHGSAARKMRNNVRNVRLYSVAIGVAMYDNVYANLLRCMYRL